MKKKNIDRRNFLKTTGTVIAGSTLVRRAFADPAGQAASATNGRMILPINRNWRYSRSVVEGGHEKTFDDSAFERVVVPHTNIKLPWHSFDDKSYEFVSLYRRHFRLPPEARGRHVFVDFEGVMTASTVWINGVRLGEYKGGYTPFSLELTPHLDFTGENVLAVDVDSTERPDIPPFGHQIDYLTFGGIYREVALRIVAGARVHANAVALHPNLNPAEPAVAQRVRAAVTDQIVGRRVALHSREGLAEIVRIGERLPARVARERHERVLG